MKKFIQLSLIFFGVVLMTLSGCSSKPKLKNLRVMVYDVDTHADTLIDFTGVRDGDSLKFDLADTRFNNGLMMSGDSVIVDYIDGDNGMKRAMVVTVLPKKSNIIDLKDKNNAKKPLQTADPKDVHTQFEY
jgi:hypothetical protein